MATHRSGGFRYWCSPAPPPASFSGRRSPPPSRVPAVLTGLILLAVWLSPWIAQRSRVVHLVDVPDFLKRAPRVFAIFCCAGAIFVPPALGNFNGGLAFKRTFVGEIAAVDKVCQSIPKGSSVLIIDNNMMQEFGQA